MCACALTVCVSTCVAELTGHQSRCGKWKWCSRGEMPGGRLGINSRICDALWSTHLRRKRKQRGKEQVERHGLSREGVLKEQNLRLTRQQATFQMQSSSAVRIQLAASITHISRRVETHTHTLTGGSWGADLQYTTSDCFLMSSVLNWTSFLKKQVKVAGTRSWDDEASNKYAFAYSITSRLRVTRWRQFLQVFVKAKTRNWDPHGADVM